EEEINEHKADEKTTNFERIEVLKGVSDMGYTAVTFINDMPKNAKIVVKGAFFVNAKMSNTGGHEH
ncbi:MAG: efflux RND transporter periplasmic adaptor subunit, partial [Chitinophagaceae bacterium]